MCDRCEDLEEQVAYLKSELGEAIRADELHAVRKAMGSGDGCVGLTSVAALLLLLYGAHGRSLSKFQLMEAMPPKHGADDDRDVKIIDVWVCRARKALGREVIETVWGRGVRLSAYGMDLIGRMLGHVQPIPEAVEMADRSPEELRSMAALIAGLLAHKDGDGGIQTAITYRRIADRLTGQPRVAA